MSRQSVHARARPPGIGHSSYSSPPRAWIARAGRKLRRPGKRDRRRRRITDVGIRDTSPQPLPSCAAEQAPGASLDALLAGVARGDQAAFEAVCARAAPTMFGVVRTVVRDPSQAEEVLQEVLLEVWSAASRFKPGRGSALRLRDGFGRPTTRRGARFPSSPAGRVRRRPGPACGAHRVMPGGATGPDPPRSAVPRPRLSAAMARDSRAGVARSRRTRRRQRPSA
jgi:Sigma-70 region 2